MRLIGLNINIEVMTKNIRNLLRLEELGQFLRSIILFCQLDYLW